MSGLCEELLRGPGMSGLCEGLLRCRVCLDSVKDY